MRITRRGALGAGAAASMLLGARPAAAAEPPSLDELLADPVVTDAAISPSGRQLAVLRKELKDGKTRAYILLADIDQATRKPAVVNLGEYQVDQVEWANDERLLIWMTFWKDAKGRPTGLAFYGEFIPLPLRRLVSVDLHGENAVVLFGQQQAVLRNGFDASEVVDFMPDDPAHVLMQVWDMRRSAPALHLVDVYTGAATLVETGNSQTDAWVTQRGVPVLRFDSNSRSTVGWIYARAPSERDWKLVRKARLNEFKKLPDFDVVGATAEPGVFLVVTRGEGQDAKVVRTFDIRSMAFGAEVAAHPGRDMEGAFLDETQALVGASYCDDRVQYEFADRTLDRHFKGINRYFNDEANVRIADADVGQKRLLLKVTGPRDQGSYHVYHRDQAKLETVGTCYPALTRERLAPMTALAFKARDGAELTAYLTQPITGPPGKRPMVVLPHGGPETRDRMDFDLMVQALAAKGWAVLQPNFRGSGGYGKAFADQGRRHWAGRMQEDVEDAVAYVLANGGADPDRLAIMGASYGGYAALMGAVRKPQLYKAVVSIAGDFDLIESLAFTRREDGADSPTYAYWLAQMGDPKTDEAALIAASPARRAAEIRAPVLLMHGTLDRVVDPKQSKIMAKALADAGRPCTYVELKGVGHRDWGRDTWKDALTRATGFLAQYI